jgi:MtN3 and saliva related transmembrane protein
VILSLSDDSDAFAIPPSSLDVQEKNRVVDQLELLGYGAAVFTTASFIPQAVKIMSSRDTQSISVWMYAMFTTGVALWLIYGLMLRSPPIILANAITFVLSSAILFMKLKNR